ncbi:MAG: hypothetical protein HYY55_01500 [Candidatus Niyogibacteria bacterium]|nr:MAG: hypothetical protein HYY55_01500 [Candidatus Niyogibacteria bacterium]
MNEKLPEYTPEEQAHLRRQRGGFVSGKSRRGGPYGKLKMKDFLAELSRGYK